MITKVCLTATCYLAAVTAMYAQAGSGSIAGAVSDANGVAVPGALVLYNNVPQTAPGSAGGFILLPPIVNSSLPTAGDGTFSIGNLPDGEYLLCPYGIQPNQLTPCAWGGSAQPVQVSGGAAVSGLNLQLAAGTVLVISVNDPAGAIVDTAAGPPVNGLLPLYGGNFRIGAMLGGAYLQAQFSSQVGTVRNYTMTAPNNVTLSLFADTQLQLTGAGGAAIPSGAPSISISVGAAATQTLQLQVTP